MNDYVFSFLDPLNYFLRSACGNVLIHNAVIGLNAGVGRLEVVISDVSEPLSDFIEVECL